MRVAIVTGITGQDGAYLAELLLAKGYKVIGCYRRSASSNFWRIQALGIQSHPNLHLLEYDLTDLSSNISLLSKIRPDEIYNLAAQSFVASSFEHPYATSQINALGVLNLLEAIRLVNPGIKFYQASTSEMFGKVQMVPQNENTPFYPRSPYGVSKLYAHWMTINYRESYNLFAVSGILFNHESPLRGREFVTRKITEGIAKLKLGQLNVLELGNLEAKRDWGFAKEYVVGMYLMMQAKIPDTFVLATGRTQTVRDFVSMSFRAAEIDIEWTGQGIHEKALDKRTGKVVVQINPSYYRPAEVDLLVGDASKAKRELNWEATTTLEQLCSMMIEADMARKKTSEEVC